MNISTKEFSVSNFDKPSLLFKRDRAVTSTPKKSDNVSYVKYQVERLSEEYCPDKCRADG